MTAQEENALNMLRRLADSEHGEHGTKQRAAGAAADKQLPLAVNDSLIVRALLIEFNLQYLGTKNRASTVRAGRANEEIRTPDGTLEKPPLQLSLFEADAVIARKRDLAAGVTAEADWLQALRDLAAERARDAGLDPENDLIIIGDYIGDDEAGDIRTGRWAA